MELTARSAVRALPLSTRPLFRQVQHMKFGSLDLEIGRHSLHVEGDHEGPAGHIQIDQPARLLHRLATAGCIGFAEGFMAGDWHSEDLSALLWVLALNEPNLHARFQGWAPIRWWTRLLHTRNANTRQGSRRNIAYHYDLGNDFYRAWLDPGMTYSAARFDAAEQTLEQAQAAKYAHMLALTGAQPGQQLLEIGCGWGGFAEYAASHGCQVTGLTLSREQLAWAQQRLSRTGLAARCDLRLCDYRDLSAEFDHIVSIEMFEAVGEAYWATYLRQLVRNLRRGGRAALQVITIDEAYFERYRQQPDFIQRYVFPGGMLPSVSAFDTLASQVGLHVVQREFGGLDYARTLAIWHDRFQTASADLTELGFDKRFLRMWRYYLSYCEAGFRSGRIDVMRLAVQSCE